MYPALTCLGCDKRLLCWEKLNQQSKPLKSLYRCPNSHCCFIHYAVPIPWPEGMEKKLEQEARECHSSLHHEGSQRFLRKILREGWTLGRCSLFCSLRMRVCKCQSWQSNDPRVARRKYGLIQHNSWLLGQIPRI